MVIKRRIETNRAKELRSQRQHFATPGGSHDKLIGFLARALPMGVGVVAALMIITPLSPRGEVSFLLDRNAVSVIEERLSVDNAMYRGRDDNGRPFSITAGASERWKIRATLFVYPSTSTSYMCNPPTLNRRIFRFKTAILKPLRASLR